MRIRFRDIFVYVDMFLARNGPLFLLQSFCFLHLTQILDRLEDTIIYEYNKKTSNYIYVKIIFKRKFLLYMGAVENQFFFISKFYNKLLNTRLTQSITVMGLCLANNLID